MIIQKKGFQRTFLKKPHQSLLFIAKQKPQDLCLFHLHKKKYVIKKKGMDTGKVALLKEEVLIVNPEIPKGVVFVEKHLTKE
jgi:hypothetical protein